MAAAELAVGQTVGDAPPASGGGLQLGLTTPTDDQAAEDGEGGEEADSAEPEDAGESEQRDNMPQSQPQSEDGDGAGGKKFGFTLGADSKAEFLDEFAFSIQHSSGQLPPELQQELESDLLQLNTEEMVQVEREGDANLDAGSGCWPPANAGHWGVQPSGWSRAGSVTGSVTGGMYSGRWSGAGNFDQDFHWEDGDTISDLIGMRRVDSKDIVYEHKKKTTKILGHYVMGEVLGEGSYAKVKEAIDTETLCRRAVKIMKKRKLRRIPCGEQNVEREIKLLQVLNHKNVMKLIEVLYNDEKEKIYMVLEYCCAVLQDMLDQSPEKRFPIWQSHDYFLQLLEGLDYLHSKGIIHKDIKPGNLLLDRSGTLKIADFGVCEQLDLYSESDTIVTSQGTPTFQPPEVAIGAETFSGAKLDVWSAGVTLFNFTTGDYPFQGDTLFRLFENIGKGEFSFPIPVDKVLEEFVRSLLTVDPEHRPTVRQARAHDWCRKRFPKSGAAVAAPPQQQGGDPLLSTTVLPYLENLHYPSPTSSQPNILTQHDLNRLAQEEVEAEECESGESALTDSHVRLKRKKSKTTTCIRFKNGCKQQ